MTVESSIPPDYAKRIDARLRVLSSLEHQRSTLKELTALRKEAAVTLGQDHPLVLEIAASAAWISTGQRSATDGVQLYERLLAIVGDQEATPTLRAPEALRSGYARALRRAGDPRALDQYRRNLASFLAKDPSGELRATGIAKLNLAVALRGQGNVPALRESLTLCEEEVRRRSNLHGPEDRFTLVARANRLDSWHALARFGTPVEAPQRILQEAEEVVEIRERILGSSHMNTIKSRITRAEALLNVGQADRALWLLTALRAQSITVPTDVPWRIPRLIAQCCLATNDPRDVMDGLRYAQQACEIAGRLLGPESYEAIRCDLVLNEISDRLAGLKDPVVD